jgi:hypothetical protein
MKEVIKVIGQKVVTFKREDESDEEEISHAVPFKCIGAAREKNYQHHLEN